ncbi:MULTISPECIES: response regulator transcription factor [unclassified Ancylobacter]|uniref:response regulator transcription factor n=1 Tax=unclassified Ancylobacter TaxID=2626613 RepID=UPI00226F9315|nr:MULTISPECIES: response regulator [unclassified Ancylobacter]WAC29443.1 response regulator [Ancylobacter sp. SL191]WGD32470.1 response regulator [Ancylobacter sp. WKF20]
MVAIIDDDESVRVATASLVRSLGLLSRTFASAEDFLRAEAEEAPDCVITDVQMPGMSGVELQATLRARGRSTPLIFITAFPEDRIRRQVTEAGAVGFLAKPFDGSEMIACLDAALGTH